MVKGGGQISGKVVTLKQRDISVSNLLLFEIKTVLQFLRTFFEKPFDTNYYHDRFCGN